MELAPNLTVEMTPSTAGQEFYDLVSAAVPDFHQEVNAHSYAVVCAVTSGAAFVVSVSFLLLDEYEQVIGIAAVDEGDPVPMDAVFSLPIWTDNLIATTPTEEKAEALATMINAARGFSA